MTASLRMSGAGDERPQRRRYVGRKALSINL
jgi:hypothetical protein